jgi:hypothetical protein
VFARHQARGYRLDDVSISLRGDGSIMQNGPTYLGFHDDGVSERFDLCAMVIPPDTIARNMDRSVIFYEENDTPAARNLDREHFFAFGYPSKLSKFDCSDKVEAIDVSQVCVDGQYLPPASSWFGLPGLKINIGPVMGERCGGNFDGFSGGPVFSIHADYRTIRFEGITMRGGNGCLEFAPASWVARLCDGSRGPSGDDVLLSEPPQAPPHRAA